MTVVRFEIGIRSCPSLEHPQNRFTASQPLHISFECHYLIVDATAAGASLAHATAATAGIWMVCGVGLCCRCCCFICPLCECHFLHLLLLDVMRQWRGQARFLRLPPIFAVSRPSYLFIQASAKQVCHFSVNLSSVVLFTLPFRCCCM